MGVKVRKYGLLPPNNWGDDALEHLRLQTRLWNALVELHLNNRKAYVNILVRTSSQVARLTEECAMLEHVLETARTEKKRLHAQTHSKQVNTSAQDHTIRESLAALKEKRVALRVAKFQAKAEAGTEIKALQDRFYADVKTALHNSGLWWGNYEAVVNSFEVARAKVLKSGGTLRFKPFTGEGRFTGRVSGGVAAEDVFKGACAWLKITPVPAAAYDPHTHKGDRRRLSRTTLTLRIYTGRDAQGKKTNRTLVWPMVMHRPLPDHAVIKNVTVNRRRIGPDFKWEVAILCAVPDKQPETRSGKGICGIAVGSRLVPGGLRVGYLVGEHEALEIALSREWMEGMEYVETLFTRMDKTLNAAVAELQTTIKAGPEALKAAARAPEWSSRTLSRAYRVWSEQAPEYEPVQLTRLVEWHRAHTKLWRQRENMRQRLLSNRLHTYRNIARAIVSRYGVVAVEKLKLSDRAVLERVKKSDREQTKIPLPVRRQRTWAALHEFLHELRWQAEKAGTVVHEIGAACMTTACNECGQNMGLTERPRQNIMQRCGHCGVLADPDKNAAWNLYNSVLRADAYDRTGDRTGRKFAGNPFAGNQ